MKSSVATLVAFASACAAAQVCGTGEPPEFLRQPVAQIQEKVSGLVTRAAESYTINTYVHVINTAASEAEYTPALIDRQLKYMDEIYADTPFKFNYVSIDFIVNDTWAKCYDPAGANCGLDYKSQTRKGTYGDLNLWFLSDLANRFGILGFAKFPGAAPTALERAIDGAVVLTAATTGATTPGYSQYQLGTTTVHEVAHWLGLFHTFQGFSCSGDGDLVDDTPQQSESNAGCPTFADSCPDHPGTDLVNNFMDYTDDVCKNSFTPGQIARMQNLYGTLRAGK